MTAAEQDLHGQVAICLMALLSWAEFHGGRTALIDDTISRFVCAGRPHDAGIDRAFSHTRIALARYLEHCARPPAWLPPSVLALLKAPVEAHRSDALSAPSPSENPQKQAANGGHSAPKFPKNEPRPTTERTAT